LRERKTKAARDPRGVFCLDLFRQKARQGFEGSGLGLLKPEATKADRK
jgi:hypothetical protein